jgi:hypothetical protein
LTLLISLRAIVCISREQESKPVNGQNWHRLKKIQKQKHAVHSARKIKNEKARATYSCPAPFVSSLST